MSQLDDKINSLSSDELDLLNSDPKLLSDFKTKYSQPPTATEGILGAVGSTLKSSLLPDVNTAIQPLSGSPTEQLKEALSPTEGLSRIGQTLREPSVAAGEAVEKFGKDINAPLTGKIGGFMAQTALDPLTYAGMKSDLLPKDIEQQIPNILEKATNIPAKATELGGYNKIVPTQQEVEKAVENVTNTVKQVWKQHGDLLNKAKQSAGIPATEDEIANSVRKYGNASNLHIGKSLELPENLKTTAPAMEQDVAGATTKDLVGTGEIKAYIKGVQKGGINPNTGEPIADVPIYGVKGDPNKIKELFGSSDVASVPKNMLESKGIPTPDVPQTPMPYKIGSHDTPEQLMTEINRFKANQDFISNKDKVKAAHYFQDQIVQQGIFKQDTTKGVINGTLKGQYGDLANMMQESSPELKAAKSKMSDLYDTMDEINKKVSGSPGEAESYLRKLFTSKSPEIKDDLKALAKIEQLSGKPVLQTLFNKFAGEAYGQLLGESIHTVFQAPYALLTSPSKIIKPAMKYGPSAVKGAKFIGAGLAERGLQQPFNTPEMQSLRDRLGNNTNAE